MILSHPPVTSDDPRSPRSTSNRTGQPTPSACRSHLSAFKVTPHPLCLPAHYPSSSLEYSLVCRAWVPLSQPIIFEIVYLKRQNLEDVYRLRRFLKLAPHIRSYVHTVNILEVGWPRQPIHTMVLAVVAPCLPSLRTIMLSGVRFNGPLWQHRFFRSPSSQASTIHTLIVTNTTSTVGVSGLHKLLLRFPNLQSFYLSNMFFNNASNPRRVSPVESTRTPTSPIRTRTEVDGILPITRIALGMAKEPSWATAIRDLDSSLAHLHEVRTLLNAASRSLVFLEININTFYYMLDPQLGKGPVPVDIVPLEPMPHLTTLVIHLRGSGLHKLYKDPYAVHIANIPKLLGMLTAKRLRIIDIHFDILIITSDLDLFLEGLGAINEDLIAIVETARFPLLEKIRLEMGYPEFQRGWCNEFLSRLFPWLTEMGMVESMAERVIHRDLLYTFGDRDLRLRRRVGVLRNESGSREAGS